MLRDADANNRLNVRVHPVGKARLIAHLAQISTSVHTVTMTEFVNKILFALPALPDGVEREIEERMKQEEQMKQQQSKAPAKTRRLKRKLTARASAA